MDPANLALLSSQYGHFWVHKPRRQWPKFYNPTADVTVGIFDLPYTIYANNFG